jgi:hypothetical protein
VLPRRLGARFALEALFLVLLALGAGLAHLRTLYIVIVMAAAWLLVALAELTAERIDRSPLSYLLPAPAVEEEEEPERVFGPRPEERTIVAPPEKMAEAIPEPVELPPPPVEEQTAEPLVREETPVSVVEEVDEAPQEPEPPRRPGRLRSLLSRREPEAPPELPSPPRHVKLLPRRTESEPSRAAQEVAELFGAAESDEPAKPEETGT